MNTTFITSINDAMAGLFPIWAWDGLEILLGSSVAILCLLHRVWSPAYSVRHVEDIFDMILKRLGQVGLSILFTASIIVVFDGAAEGFSPPRTFTCIFLLGIMLIQARNIRLSYHQRSTSLSRGTPVTSLHK